VRDLSRKRRPQCCLCQGPRVVPRCFIDAGGPGGHEYEQRYHENNNRPCSDPALDGPDPNLEEIIWEEWFRAFDENGLAFIYEADERSTFNKLVSRETAEERPRR
jgi:hypothetical protein